MVVLAASITTRHGKPLLSRQFRDLTKDRVMELLSNFQGLVANISSDHTFVEDEHVRYVYKPFDDYYIILITNRQSNIVQDLSTLNLFSQTVNSSLSNFDENEIYDNAFEILSSFDEIVVMGGYKENLNWNQVETYLAMESHEERIQNIIEQNKESEATEERKRRAKEIARKELERKSGVYPSSTFGESSRLERFGPSSDPNVKNAYDSYYRNASAAAQESYLNSKKQQQQQQQQQSSQEYPYQPTTGIGRSASNTGASHVPKPHRQREEIKRTNNGILILINETINAELQRDGSITSSELKGVLELRVNDPALSHSKIALVESMDVKDKSFQFKTHPNIDKNQFLSSKLISLRDSKKAFPSNDQSLGVLRWRKICPQDDNSLVPLLVSTWVSSDPGSIDVTMEFEINEELFDADSNVEFKDLCFNFAKEFADVTIMGDSNDHNAKVTYKYGKRPTIQIPSLTVGNPGVVTFTITDDYDDEERLFPIDIEFKHVVKDNETKSLAGVGVATVITTSSEDQEEGQELPYDVVFSLSPEQYTVV
ncbi:coatomer subunit delta NDAI_0B06320 [Naumovozyma dairenensis CBS 421]|uniref:Coatomer subunit delta n=1 Tax=Naumovozyma dairenensis (strain ATCC 10597 / BCRC 20456 / CBS 421 / NBRC 0211 / NRRL Y-12639) TaxID=1071378 RepID=G0W7A2_NAUDC|nr:hypothetical protein NDAI_0B06320 [Naumovozyma dairenensis CBS 421]CCD23663.1 hypothetical protein NDAI_0B06320 [Naumovozyma dairenensis CBS 421]